MSREQALSELTGRRREEMLRACPPGDCKLCGVHMAYTEREYERMGLCWACADKIVNHFWQEHAGEYLTWDNPPRAQSKKKAKISNSLRLKVYDRDGYKCVYCGSRKDLTLDHVKAESKGGETVAGNLATSCKTCNSRKKTKSLSEFWEQRP